MTQISTPDACHTCGFVDNASALPTTPQVPFQNPKRTFDLFYPADIFTRQRHHLVDSPWRDPLRSLVLATRGGSRCIRRVNFEHIAGQEWPRRR